MKRSFPVCLVLGVALAVAACGSPADVPPSAETVPEGWVTSPQVETVVRSGSSIRVGGTAAPLGRVVLTGSDRVAYAAGADEQGHFDVRIPISKQDALLAVKTQVGQIAYPAPYRLLVAADPRGPIAFLAIGAPTRRLDAVAGLDSIDTDGRVGFLSGRAAPGQTVAVERSGSGRVTADAAGRWTLPASGDVGAPVRVAGQTFVPPPLVAVRDGVLERAGQGWRLAWGDTEGGRQVTWFPDKPRP